MPPYWLLGQKGNEVPFKVYNKLDFLASRAPRVRKHTCFGNSILFLYDYIPSPKLIGKGSENSHKNPQKEKVVSQALNFFRSKHEQAVFVSRRDVWYF